MATKSSKQALLDTYSALGDNDFTIAHFAKGLKDKVITIDDLWLIGKPKNNGQAFASLGAYAYVQFSMPVETIGDWVSIFTAKPVEALSAMRNATDLPALTSALSALEAQVSTDAEARKGESISSGAYQKTRITSITNKIGELKAVSLSAEQAQALLDALQVGVSLANEVLEAQKEKVA